MTKMKKLRSRIAAILAIKAKEWAEKQVDGFVEAAWLDKNQDKIKFTPDQESWIERAFSLGYEIEDLDANIRPYASGTRWYFNTIFCLYNEILRESPHCFIRFPEYKNMPKSLVFENLKNQEIAQLKRKVEQLEQEIKKGER